MSGSALLGQPPNNENDALIILGWWKLLYGSNPPPPGYPSTIPAPVPPHAPHDSLQPYVIGTSALIIFLTTLITGTRLFLRIYRRELRWGADDWAILLGASGVVVFFGLTLAVGIKGGAGKHMYDTTYDEYAFLFMVSRSLNIENDPATKTSPVFQCLGDHLLLHSRNHQNLNMPVQSPSDRYDLAEMDDLSPRLPGRPSRLHHRLTLRLPRPLQAASARRTYCSIWDPEASFGLFAQ